MAVCDGFDLTRSLTVHAISGATGLLGSHIAEQLCARGHSYEKAQQQLGWNPRVETREQLARTMQLLIADSASAGVEP